MSPGVVRAEEAEWRGRRGGGRSRRDLWATEITLSFPWSEAEPHKGSEQGRDVA